MIFFRWRRKERREKLAVLSLLRPCFPRSDRAYYNRKVESKTIQFNGTRQEDGFDEKYWEIKMCASSSSSKYRAGYGVLFLASLSVVLLFNMLLTLYIFVNIRVSDLLVEFLKFFSK